MKKILVLLLNIFIVVNSYAQVKVAGDNMIAIAIVDIYNFDYIDDNYYSVSDEVANRLPDFRYSLEAKSQETTNKVNHIFNMERFVITGAGTDIATVYKINKILEKAGLSNQEIASLFENFKQSCENGSLDKDSSFANFYVFIKETLKLVEKKDRRSNFKDFLMPSSNALKVLLKTTLLSLDSYEKINFDTTNNYENDLAKAKELYYFREATRKHVENLEKNIDLGFKLGYHDIENYPQSLIVVKGRFPEFLAAILKYIEENVPTLKDTVLLNCGNNSAFVILKY